MTAFKDVAPGTAGWTPIDNDAIRTMRGEPEVLYKVGTSMAVYGHLMNEVGAQLRTIKEAELDQWKISGDAADKLRSSIGDASEMITIAGALYLPIGQAIGRYGSSTQHYQEELNSLAVRCQELWQKHKDLLAQFDGSPVPDEDDEDFAEKSAERQKLDSEASDVHDEWNQLARNWENRSVGWLNTVYQPAVDSLSDPALDSIRKGEDPSRTLGLELYPHGAPKPGDVRQSGAGDCYLLAVLAGMAKVDPQKIKDMITANPDGTYTVHFADGDITVGGDQIPDSSQAGWVRIIEAAYEIHEGGFIEFNNGGRPEAVMEDIYGKGADIKDHEPGAFDFFTGGNDVDKSYADMKKALADGRPVVADALSGQLGFGDPNTGGGHALTITRVYEKDGVKIIEIRNPWGANWDHEAAIRNAGGTLKDPDNGYITMSMEDFAQSFTYVEIANK